MKDINFSKRKSLKLTVLLGFIWRILERFGVQGINFIIQLVLARLLLPKDFGTVALLGVVVSISNTLINNGLGTAIIQKKDPDETDYCSVFYLQLGLSVIFYTMVFFAAPTIASFYEDVQFIPLLRAISLVIILDPVSSMQNNIIMRRMAFKKSFFSNLVGLIVQGCVGILMAYQGYGVWSLVISQLSYKVIVTLVLWFTVNWRPKILFSFSHLKSLFDYGWKIAVGWIIGTLYQNSYILIIGNQFSDVVLGYYNRGNSVPHMINTNVNQVISSVMLPTVASVQNDGIVIKSITRRMIRLSAFLVFPTMAGLAAVAKSFVLIALTDKWISSVPMMQICCISNAISTISMSSIQSFNAIGRSDVFLKRELIKCSMAIILISVLSFINIYAVLWGTAAMAVVTFVLNIGPNKKLLDYGWKEQISDIIPSLLLSLVMFCFAFSIQFIGLNSWATICIQILVGIVVYIAGAYFLRFECLTYLLNSAREFTKKE